VGRPLIYHLLQAYDLDFPELFKVKADFDIHMEATAENVQSFVGMIATLCHRFGLKPLDKKAVARVLEHSSRMVEDKQKLSTHFGALADILKEAHFWADQENAECIGVAQVQRALDKKVHRSDLLREHIHEMIQRGTLLVDTTGQAVGQLNGISVMDLGDYTFGKPSRITASVGPGAQGIVDIEREVELGGAVHSKGVLILGGYLTQKYAQDMVLTLAGRLVFEQSYEGVEGDSASGAELFAILSALSKLPIKQGIAVTGSVNQHGEVQPIGSVNDKVEGFYGICKAQGLPGEQGVVIPQGNVQHLMLSDEVVQAVRDHRFHIWAIKDVDEGMEILTGVLAGEVTADGEFPPGTVNYLVQERLAGFAEYLKEYPEVTGGGPVTSAD
jgi:predicted ATP-dependent protease